MTGSGEQVLFWVLAPLSGVFGGASWTMPVGTALVQGGALVWLVLLARRRGGFAFAVAAGLSLAALLSIVCTSTFSGKSMVYD